MGWLTRWARRIGYFVRRDREERELDEELRFHMEREAEELVARGVPPAEARRRAAVLFGGVDRYREEVREARGVRWLDDLQKDVAFAVRTLRRSPGFSLGSLLVLALGIGATTAMFGVVDAVLLRPLPYPDADRLVRVWQAAPVRGADRASFSVPDLREWRDRSSSLSHVAGYTRLLGAAVLTGEGPAEEIPTAWVTGDFFGVFGVPARIGRTLQPGEEGGADRVVVLSHDYWQRRFGGDPGLVGRTLTLDQQPFEVVGVMPPGFTAPDPEVDAWIFLSVVPQSAVPWEQRFVRFLQGVGRLAPGVPVERAEEELGAVATTVARELPETNEDLTGATVVPLRSVMVGDVRTQLWLLLGAVGFILLIVCTNVAGLLLARGGGRSSEMAVRMSMGAGRGRIVRQLLAESGVLGVVGGLLGVGVAWLGTRAFLTWGGELVPRSGEVALGVPVLGFAVGLTLLTTLLFGVLPALRTADVALGRELRESGRGGTAGAGGVRLRRVLVAGEVAVAVVLLVGAGLLVRSLVALGSVDPGFDPEGVAAMTLSLSLEKYPTAPEYMALYREILDRTRRIPGVTAVGSVRRMPTRGGGEDWPFRIPGVYEPPPDEDPDMEGIHVGGDAFEALGTRVLRGRAFDEGDVAGAPWVTVVNEAFVDRYMAGVEPLGRTVEASGVELEIVGVVEDIRHYGLDVPAEPVMYVHQEQNTRIAMTILARVDDGRPERVLGEMRALVTELDADQPISDLAPLESVVFDSMARPRFITILLGSFAGLAAFLAAVGIYGVIAYTVRQRVREMGLRMALGARSGDVVGLVVRQGMIPALAGLAVGIGGAVLLSRVMETVLFQVEPLDAAAYIAAGVLLAVLSLLACGVPAVRAGRLRPMEVLRSE